jgi:hypothetical protein
MRNFATFQVEKGQQSLSNLTHGQKSLVERCNILNSAL